MQHSKQSVAEWWDESPCGSTEVQHLPEGSKDYFDALEQLRYGKDDHMVNILDFDSQEGKKVLEVGCSWSSGSFLWKNIPVNGSRKTNHRPLC